MLFKKNAYDFINRSLLWKKLSDTDFEGSMLNALRSLYKKGSSSVRINDQYIKWFENISGLRQGYSLSPLLFIFVLK
jgi:hypothetical protein